MSANPSNKFVDTNILIYAYDPASGEKNHLAEKLLRDLWLSDEGCLSIQVLQEFYVVATGKPSIPISTELAAVIVADLSRWRVHIPNPADVLQAISMHHTHQISFWDAMILNSAAQLGCDTLYTEDLNHEQTYGSVKVVNPFN